MVWVLEEVCQVVKIFKNVILELCFHNLKVQKLLHKNIILLVKKWKNLHIIVIKEVMKQQKKEDLRMKLFLLKDLIRKRMKKLIMLLMKVLDGQLNLKN
mmetsp:Transcript_6347/g.18844  ORF Transcript_6347/g.18844 Transcript_6347/m.18844 type:complete len:99 (-) Transcript_6347:38-334(-)